AIPTPTAPAAQSAATDPSTANSALTWQSLRAANPQVTEEQLLMGLLYAAMRGAMSSQEPVPAPAPANRYAAPQPAYAPATYRAYAPTPTAESTALSEQITPLNKQNA